MAGVTELSILILYGLSRHPSAKNTFGSNSNRPQQNRKLNKTWGSKAQRHVHDDPGSGPIPSNTFAIKYKILSGPRDPRVGYLGI